MTQINPIKVATFQEEGTQLFIDTYVFDDQSTTIYYKIKSASGALLIDSNFQLTPDEFAQWGDTMESLKVVVLERLGLTEAEPIEATTLEEPMISEPITP